MSEDALYVEDNCTNVRAQCDIQIRSVQSGEQEGVGTERRAIFPGTECQLGGGSEGTSNYEARKGGLSALPPEPKERVLGWDPGARSFPPLGLRFPICRMGDWGLAAF